MELEEDCNMTVSDLW